MKLTYEDKVQIYELRKQGFSYSRLADRFGIDARNLSYMIKLIDRYGLEIVDGADKYFIPSSILAELRRMVVEELDKQILNMQRVTIHRKSVNKVSDHKPHISMVNPSQYQQLPYLYNISNDAARKFYEQQGLTKAEPAFEIQYPSGATNGSDSSNKAFSIKGDKEAVSHLLMQCRHCIRYSLGYCVKRGGQKPTWQL